MATKFAWVLKIPRLPFRGSAKALVFGAGAALLAPAGAFGAIAFVVLAMGLYAYPPFRLRSEAGGFLTLLGLILLIAPSLPSLLLALFGALCAALFYLLLGLKDVRLVERRMWQELLALALLYGALMLFFLASPSLPFAIRSLLLFVTASLTLRDLLGKTAHAMTLALIVFELAWGASLLPFGQAHAAGAAFIPSYILVELASRWREGGLTRRLLLGNLTLGVFLVLALFATVEWGL